MTEPTIVYDFEFGFIQGPPQFFTAVEGRDTIETADEHRVRLELHPDADTIEEVIVTRASLAYMRTTTRTVPVEPEITEGLKLVGIDG